MDRLIGVFLVAFSAACFGINPIFARVGSDAGVNPVTFLFIRFTIASGFMLLIMLIRGLKFPRVRLLVSLVILSSTAIYGILVTVEGLQLPTVGAGWAAMVAGALISTVLGLIALFAGLKRIDTANTAIISTFEVVSQLP